MVNGTCQNQFLRFIHIVKTCINNIYNSESDYVTLDCVSEHKEVVFFYIS